MNSHLNVLFSAILIVLLTTGTARGEFHVFQLAGTPVNAQLVKVEGDTISLKADDGKLWKLDFKYFEPPDQEYLNNVLRRKVSAAKGAPQAMPQQSVAARPNLEVTWTKERSDSTQSAKVQNYTTTSVLGGGGGFQRTTSSTVQKSASNTFLLHIKVVNKSPAATGDLELHYQLVLNSTEISFYTGGKSKTTQNNKSGVIKCASLAPGASTMVDTASFTLDTEDSQNNSAAKTADGRMVSGDRHHKDEFKGVIATFTRAGETVFEYVTPGLKKP